VWTCIQPCAFAILFASTLFHAAPRGAADGNEPDEPSQDEARIEKEFAHKVETYNTLLTQERFAEAIVLGDEARLLQPENPMGELMVLKAKFAKRDAISGLSRRFKASLAADLPEDSDGSKTIEKTLRIADRAIHRLVSGEDEDAADARPLLDDSLDRRIEAVHQICRLTDAQKRKLRLAGRGDIKRFLDRIEALRPNLQRSRAVHDDDLRDLELCGNASFVEAEALRPPRRFGLFEHGSLFSKTLKTSLTEDQAGAFEASTLRRQEAGE
jgi:hypothetical protein